MSLLSDILGTEEVIYKDMEDEVEKTFLRMR